MPTYQYACTACDHRFDAVQSFADASLTECPACSGVLRKVFSSVGIVFKGSGFYRTDSRAGSAAGNGDGKGEAAKGDGAKGDGAKTDGAKTGNGKSDGTKGESSTGGGSSTTEKKQSTSSGSGSGSSSSSSSRGTPASAAS